MSLFSILVDISASSAQFESEMSKVNSTLEAVGNTAKRALEFTGVTLSLGALADSFTKAAESGEQLTQLSTRLGASVESLSQLQYAAEATNVPFATLTGAIDTLQRNLVQASEGSGKAKQALADLGIDAAKLASLPLDQQLDIIADKIAALPNPTQQTAAAMRIFGSAGAALLPILQQGAAGIDALRGKSDDLGATMSALSAGSLTDANKALTDLSVSSHAFWTQIAADIAPAVTSWESGVLTIEKRIRDLTGDFSSPQQEMHDLVTQAINASNQLNQLNSGNGFEKWLNSAGGATQLVATDVADLTKRIAALAQQIAAAPAALAPAKPTANVNEQFGKLPTDFDFQVTATKTLTDYMQQYYDRLNVMSQTDTERTVADWQTKEDAARNYTQHVFDTIDPSDISAVVDAVAEQANRFTDINEQFLQPIEVTAKYVTKTVKPVYDDMQKYAQQAATSIQSDFATFLTDPSIDSFKKMGVAWLQDLDKMVADATAADLFGALFHNKSSPTSGLGGILAGLIGGGGASVDSAALGSAADTLANQGLDSLLGFANGGSFSVGGSGGTDSQMVAFKATPGEHVQVGGGGQGGGDTYYITNTANVTSPQVTKADVIGAMKQTQDSTVARIQDMQRRRRL